MQVDPHTEWIWKPAPQSWDRRAKVMVGALGIMAAGCIAAGVVMGRMTAGPASGYGTAHVGSVANGEIPTPAPATPGVQFKKQPEPETPVVGGTAPSVVILNPGTADVGKQEDPDRAANTRIRDASKLRSDVRNPDPRDQRPPATPDRFGKIGDRSGGFHGAGLSRAAGLHAQAIVARVHLPA
jgi:hypothetical protein